MRFPSRSICAATLVATAGTLSLLVLETIDGGRAFDPIAAALLGMISGFAVLGALIARRRPDNRIGLVFSLAAAIYGLQMIVNEYADYVLLRRPSLPAGIWAGWLGDVLWFPANAATMVFVFLLFPDGRFPAPRWRWLGRAALALAAGAAVAGAVHPGPLSQPLEGYRNPAGIEGATWIDAAMFVTFGGILVCWVGAVASLVIRYRRAGPLEQAQVRWFALAAVSVPLCLLISIVANWRHADVASGVAGAAAGVAVLGLPVAIGIAILRRRLYDLDTVFRRTLTYAALVASLTALYLVAIAALGALSRAITGQNGKVAVTVSTLMVAAAFQPLRRRFQTAVDRRFAREGYDAARTLASFAGRLRDQVDLAAVEREIVTVVAGTVQPDHVALWLRPATRR